MIPDGVRKFFPGPQRSRAATGFRAIQKNAIIFRSIPLAVCFSGSPACYISAGKEVRKGLDAHEPLGRRNQGKTDGKEFCASCESNNVLVRRSAIPRFDGIDLMHWSGRGK
jgi:hypothetical protein